MGRWSSIKARAREVSGVNLVIALKWVRRERSIADTVHPARMLAADKVRSGERAKPEGATVINVSGR